MTFQFGRSYVKLIAKYLLTHIVAHRVISKE